MFSSLIVPLMVTPTIRKIQIKVKLLIIFPDCKLLLHALTCVFYNSQSDVSRSKCTVDPAKEKVMTYSHHGAIITPSLLTLPSMDIINAP